LFAEKGHQRAVFDGRNQHFIDVFIGDCGTGQEEGVVGSMAPDWEGDGS
jgi:hypothetical protein